MRTPFRVKAKWRTQEQRLRRQAVLDRYRDDADLPGTVQAVIDTHFRTAIERATATPTGPTLTVVDGRIVRAN